MRTCLYHQQLGRRLPPRYRALPLTRCAQLRDHAPSNKSLAYPRHLACTPPRAAVATPAQPPFIFKRLPFLPRGGGSGTHDGGAAGTLAAAAAADVPFFVALRQSMRSSAQPPQLLTQAGAAVAGAMGGPALGAMLALAAAVANASGFVAAVMLRGHQHPAVLTWWYNGVLAVVSGRVLYVEMGPVSIGVSCCG